MRTELLHEVLEILRTNKEVREVIRDAVIGSEVKDETLEEKLERYYQDEDRVDCSNQFKDLATIARTHFKEGGK